METVDLKALEAFAAVARLGSFTRAAATLNVRKSHVSRLVSRLEAGLGVQLLRRTTRSVTLTEVGQETLGRAQGVLVGLEALVRAARHGADEPRGVLRITCGVEFGLACVGEWVSRFLARWPAVSVETDFTNRVVDVVQEGFDLAVRVGALADSSLSSRRLGVVDYGLFAAPAWIRAHGAPTTPEALATKPLILSTQTRSGDGSWQLRSGARVFTLERRPRLLVNTHFAVRDAIVAGTGIGLLPVFQVASLVKARALVRVMARWSREPVPVHLVFPASRFVSTSQRAFIDLAVASFAALTAR